MHNSLPRWVTGGRRIMSAATAAFLGSGRRMRATVAPRPLSTGLAIGGGTCSNCGRWLPATLASATGPGVISS
jgi:hypothetical protein